MLLAHNRNFAGIGKTTLANEIYLRWARDGFLTEDFDAIILISLRLVQQRSLREVVIQHSGEEIYQHMQKSAGTRCLIILEGFDEMAPDRRHNDPFLFHLIEECTIMEEGTIIITSRPHACDQINAGRRLEVVGFGKDEIRKFLKESFPGDIQSVKEFLWQLNEYPRLCGLCYIPMNSVMILDIFQCSKKKLPSTLTELYKLFVVMTLNRQVRKENSTKKLASSSVAEKIANSLENTLSIMLNGIPKDTVAIVLCLSQLAYQGFFEGYCQMHSKGKQKYDYKEWKDAKIIFTESDLIQCGIKVTNDFDGFGLLKTTQTHELPTDIKIYSFHHLTIQEFLCAVYISIQPKQEQLMNLLNKYFHEYPNVFTFVFGLTGVMSSEMLQFVYTKLTDQDIYSDVITAMRCISEGKQNSDPHHSLSPFTLEISYPTSLLPYDYSCLSNVLLCYPIAQLTIEQCTIDNKEAELLVKHYSNKNTTDSILEEFSLSHNGLTCEGMTHVVKIVRASKLLPDFASSI